LKDGGIKKLLYMKLFLVFLIMFLVVAVISWLWVTGIDNMKKNHPDYKGEDFLDWEEDDEYEN
jgi:hypothetical protein